MKLFSLFFGLKQKLPAGLLFVIILASIVGGFAPAAQAHVLQSDNGVSVVLHIEPADDPVAGAETLIGLEFNSTNPNFNLKDYTVTANVQGTSVTASQPPVTVTSDGSAPLYGTAQVLFPDPGSYNLIVKGVSAHNAATDFKLTFEIRAERPQAAGSNTMPTTGSGGSGNGFDSILIGAAALGLLGVLAHYQISQGGRYVKSATRGGKK